MDIKVQLTKIIGKVLDKNFEEIGDLAGKDLFEDLLFDSISIMQLILDLEDEFKVTLGEEELIESINNFDMLCNLIEKKLQICN